MILKLPTNNPNFLYEPSFQDVTHNFQDAPGFYSEWVHRTDPNQFEYNGTLEFTECNQAALRECVKSLHSHPGDILEIGMCRNASCSTATIVAGKPKDSKYLGIDLRDLSSFANPSENVHVLQSDSFAQDSIRVKMKELGFGPLQLLSIDGWHSIQMVINDFAYVDLLQKGGVVFFHDISHHPGPRELIAALNPDKWIVIKQCPEDYGAGIAIKKY